jgi:hypothetical protein
MRHDPSSQPNHSNQPSRCRHIAQDLRQQWMLRLAHIAPVVWLRSHTDRDRFVFCLLHLPLWICCNELLRSRASGHVRRAQVRVSLPSSASQFHLHPKSSIDSINVQQIARRSAAGKRLAIARNIATKEIIAACELASQSKTAQAR